MNVCLVLEDDDRLEVQFLAVKVGEHDRCQPSFIAIRHAVKKQRYVAAAFDPIIDRIGLSIRDRRQVVPLQLGLVDETGQESARSS